MFENKYLIFFQDRRNKLGNMKAEYKLTVKSGVKNNSVKLYKYLKTNNVYKNLNIQVTGIYLHIDCTVHSNTAQYGTVDMLSIYIRATA